MYVLLTWSTSTRRRLTNVRTINNNNIMGLFSALIPTSWNFITRQSFILPVPRCRSSHWRWHTVVRCCRRLVPLRLSWQVVGRANDRRRSQAWSHMHWTQVHFKLRLVAPRGNYVIFLRLHIRSFFEHVLRVLCINPRVTPLRVYHLNIEVNTYMGLGSQSEIITLPRRPQ